MTLTNRKNNINFFNALLKYYRSAKATLNKLNNSAIDQKRLLSKFFLFILASKEKHLFINFISLMDCEATFHM